MPRLLLLLALAACSAPAARLRFPVPAAHSCSRGFLPAEHHFALDVPAAIGTPVLASGAGVVVRASSHPSYGLAVILRHAATTYTLYAHLSAIAVTLGERVRAGARIGAVGATGNARGAHLHFEVLEAPAPLPLRPDGPIGIPGQAYRIDPASVVDVPSGCATIVAWKTENL